MAKTIEFVTEKGSPAFPVDSPTFLKKVRERKDGEAVHFHTTEKAVGPFSQRCGKCGKHLGVAVGFFRPALPVWTDRDLSWEDHADRCVPKVKAA